MNKIHPTVIIGKDVILGDGNEILPYTIIEGPVTIGNILNHLKNTYLNIL